MLTLSEVLGLGLGYADAWYQSMPVHSKGRTDILVFDAFETLGIRNCDIIALAVSSLER